MILNIKCFLFVWAYTECIEVYIKLHRNLCPYKASPEQTHLLERVHLTLPDPAPSIYHNNLRIM